MNTYRMVAAVSTNRVLGKDNKLLWRQSEDLKRFKALTIEGIILMGRKTYESIGSKPLPKRRNIVLTSQPLEGVETYASIEGFESAVQGKTVNVIGGGEIYRQFLPKATHLEITEIETEIEGDTFFPEFDLTEWQETERIYKQKDGNNQFNYTFVSYTRTI